MSLLLTTVEALLLCSMLSACALPTLNNTSADIYITSPADLPCTDTPCLTLEQLASNTTPLLKPRTTLLLLPGNHTLASQLLVDGQSVHSFLLLSAGNDSQITCSDLGGLRVSSVSNVLLKNVRFLECEVIMFESVTNLMVRDCTFLIRHLGRSLSPNGTLELKNTVATFTNTKISSTNNKLLYVHSQSNFMITNSILYDSHLTHSSSPSMIIQFEESTITIHSSILTNNQGETIAYAIKCNVSLQNTRIVRNIGILGVLYLVKSDIFLEGVTYSENHGPFIIKVSDATLRGSNLFERNVQQNHNVSYFDTVCGTLKSIQSEVTIYGATIFRENNSTKSGGAVCISESGFYVYESLTVTHNRADCNGGGVFIHQGSLFCYGHCKFSYNEAGDKGGGLYASSAVLMLKSEEKWKEIETNYVSLTVAGNSAKYGGGLYFEVSSKFYTIEDRDCRYKIELVGNSATQHGGAIYVNDSTYPEVCESPSIIHQPKTGCFLQVQYSIEHTSAIDDNHLLLIDNNTADNGSGLYGGLIDRCRISSPYYLTDKDIKGPVDDDIVAFLHNSTVPGDSVIASDAVRVCFCSGTEPNCSLEYQPPPISVKKGELFNVSVIAVDQVNHPVNGTTIWGSVPPEDKVEGLHVSQLTTEECTNLTYNISTWSSYVDLGLYARNGPCKDLGLSKKSVRVEFKNCTCPIGFQSQENEKRCDCVCNDFLTAFVETCNYHNESFIKTSKS